MSTVSPAEVIQAYRALQRTAIRAVQFSKPARFIVRDTIRDGFRRNGIEAFQPDRIANTIAFLDSARRYRGVEHKLVKNLLAFRYKQRRNALIDAKGIQKLRGNEMKKGEAVAHELFEKTLFWVNQSLGLCLR